MQKFFTSVSNSRWADVERTMIDCEVTASQFGDEVLPFTASQNDHEAHGRALFADLVAGVYGEIADYVPPPPPPLPEITTAPPSGEIPGSVL